MKNVGRVTLKNSLVLLLWDPRILMGILGVVDVLDEVELDVVLGTHLTKAFEESSNASISS